MFWTLHKNEYVQLPDNDALALAVQKPQLDEANEERCFVSAPGKVSLFGEHAVVHGVTAIAASVDLRCYGLTSPRSDGKISVHFQDMENFYHEWEDVGKLPWDAVTPVVLGDEHPEELDQRLIDDLDQRA